jgi:RNase adaptor protein for sRNA GlmZ degradation
VIGVDLTSFGYLHGAAPEADLTVDVRRYMHDPARMSTALLESDGRALAVQRVVEGTDGARQTISTVLAFVAMFPRSRRCVVALGCAGGRHRSVALVELLAPNLTRWPAIDLRVHHRDVHRPRVL